MNKSQQRMSGAGGEPRRHGPSGGGGPLTIYHRILSPPLSPGGWPCQCHPNDHTGHYMYIFVWCHN